MLKVKKRTLLLVAGLVWLAAGVNILTIGIRAIVDVWGKGERWQDILLPVFSLMILVGFFLMFFRIVGKHEKRILGYTDEKVSFFLFFDLKGYLLMAFMMALGIVLRKGDFLPTYFFAFFYTGLGIALSVSGCRFLVRFFQLRLRQILWICVGLVSVGLGTLGIFLPILPTVPLYLLGSFAFLNSSHILDQKFKNSRLYKRYLLPYIEAGGLTLRAKLCLVLFVTLQIGIAAFLVRKSVFGLVLVGFLYLGFLISMILIVKTVRVDEKNNKE